MKAKVIIIEDDMDVVERIKDFVLKYEGLKLIDKLSPKKDKLAFLKDIQPDIVILNCDTIHTDGRRLIEGLKTELSDTKIILILDYPHFESAQKALNEWGISYLLDKSQITEENLVKALSDVLKQLHIEKVNSGHQDRTEDFLEKQNDISLYIMHEDVVAGAGEEYIKRAEKSLGVQLDFTTQEFYLGFCGFESEIYTGHNKDGHAYLAFFKNLRSKIRNMNGAGYKAEIFIHTSSKKFVLIVSRDPCSGIEGSAEAVIEEVHRLIQCEFEEIIIITRGRTQYQNFTVVSERLSGLGSHVRNAFQNIIRMSQLSFFIAEQKIARQEDVEALYKPSNVEHVSLMLDHVKGALISGQRTRLECAMKKLFIGTLKYSFNKLLCSYSLDYLIKLYIKTAQYNGIIYEINLEKVFSVDQYTSIENACEKVLQIFIELQNIIVSKMSPKSIIIQEVIDYIQQNYGDKISLKEISEYVCISSSYLCRMFKQETGKSLNQFITGVRVKNAQNLMDNTDYKIWEICDKTGFLNSKYFSQVFKKIVGMTPKEYKERQKEVSEIG